MIFKGAGIRLGLGVRSPLKVKVGVQVDTPNGSTFSLQRPYFMQFTLKQANKININLQYEKKSILLDKQIIQREIKLIACNIFDCIIIFFFVILN